MAGILIFRLEGRDDFGGSELPHVQGRSRPRTAVTREGWPASESLGPDRVDNAKAAILAAPKCRGRKPRAIYSWIAAGPPRFLDPDAWSQEKCEEWGRKFVAELQEAFPASVIISPTIHYDEASPHLHGLILFRDEDGRLGANRVLPEAAGEPAEP